MARGRITKSSINPTASGNIETSQSSNVRDRENEIRERAYAIWEHEGKPEGKHLEHWERAEKQIDGEFAPGGVAIENDEVSKLAAQKEVIRERRDTLLVASDLEDASERETIPGTQE